MKKRILPALLALCMVMSLLPVAVFADITPTENKCQCTNTSCTNNTTHGSASSDGACTADPVNGDTKCADCGGVEKFACTCTGNCKDGDGHVEGHSEGYTLNAAGVCSACQTAIDAADGDDTPDTPETKTYTAKVEGVDLTCTCTLNHSDDGVHDRENEGETTCGNTATKTITVTFEYVVELGEGATEEEQTEWQSGYNDAKNAAVDEFKNAWLCDACTKDETDACTGAVLCDAQAHKKDCLSKCTMSDACENSAGVASAHKVTYTATVTTTVDGTAGEPVTVDGGPFYSYGDVVDAINTKIAALQDGEDESKAYQYASEITTHHCPRAGVVDSTVLGPTDETTDPADTTDPATPEVKAPEKAEDFADLKGDEWYAEDLTALVEKGIFTGSLDDGKYSFNATGNVTGAELVVLLSRVAGEDLVTTGAEWNKAATAWAAEAGYTEGLDINTTGKLTRQDVILILWRAAGKPDSEQELSFTDAEGLEGDYLTAMKWAVEKKIIGGYEDNTVKPDGNITRAEMVTVLTRYDAAK